MSTSAATPTSVRGSHPQAAPNALLYLQRAIEKMKSLQATEHVMARVERVMLDRVPAQFDLKPLATALNALNTAIRAGAEPNVQAFRETVSRELEAAFRLLARRDEHIMPYNLRRFCEGDGVLLELNSLAALTSFYRALPHTEANRGKYDFIVTRLFTSPEPGRSGRYRQLRISREQLAKRLTEMCLAWGEPLSRAPAETTQIAAFTQQFDRFIAEVNQINKFEDLVNNAFFPRVRDFKADVGRLLYLPEITAASIESNVTINNRFLTLLEIESGEPREMAEALHSLAGAYSAPYANESDEVSRILRELQTDAQHDEVAQERISRFTRLLQIATKPEEEPSLPMPPRSGMLVGEREGFLDALPEPVGATAPTVASEMDAELQAFAAQPENQSLLAAYGTASAEVRKLDLRCFLASLPDETHEELKGESNWRRAALELIFCADQLVQAELGKDCEPGADIEARVDKLFDNLGQLSDEMRGFIKVTHKYEQNASYEVLLHVYNQLMAARLRLQSAIVRRSTSELTQSHPQAKTTTARIIAQTAQEPTQEPAPKAKQEPAARAWSRKRLLLTCLILMAAAMGLHFALPKNKEEAKDGANVARLNQGQMPHGEFFAEAKLHQDMIICIVTEKWLELSAQEQKEKLKDLLNFGHDQGAKRVMLINLRGSTVGFVTKEDVYVN